MTRAESGRILAMLAAAFSHTMTEGEPDVWHATALEHIDVELAERTAERIIRQDVRWPTPARFNGVRRALMADVPPERQLPEAKPAEEVWRKGLADARAAIKEARQG